MSLRVRRAGLLLALIATACLGGRRARAPQPAAPPPAPAPVDTIARPTPDTAAKPVAVAAPDTVPKGAPPRPPGETAPGQRCLLNVDGNPGSRAYLAKNTNTGKYVTYIGGGITGRCARQDITITGDSAESYDDNRTYYLIGNVKYREKRINLDADKLTYFGADERILLENNVRATLPSGTTMVGANAEYFRAVRGVRAVPRLVGRGRPIITFIERDSLGKEAAPVTLEADQIVGVNDSLFYASRRVVLTRTDLVARSDSGFVDNGREYARLMLGPQIESKGSEPYTLRGKAIDIYARNRQAERVVAQDSAVAISKDLTQRADTIDLRVHEQKLQLAYAFGGRAHATTPERDIFADSLEVIMPNQRIREFFAVGNAYAESDPDTSKIVSDERDWLRGDTIHAVFDSLPPTDTTSSPDIRRLVSSGNASSYFQVPPSDSTLKDTPSINYVRGRLIEVEFANKEAEIVRVVDQATGVYVEPTSSTDTTRAGSRSTRVATPPRRPPTVPRPKQ